MEKNPSQFDVTPDRERRGLEFLAGVTQIIKSRFPDLSVSTATSVMILRFLEDASKDSILGLLKDVSQQDKEEVAPITRGAADDLDRELAKQYEVGLIIFGTQAERIRSFVHLADGYVQTLRGQRKGKDVLITESTWDRTKNLLELMGKPLQKDQPTIGTPVVYIFK